MIGMGSLNVYDTFVGTIFFSALFESQEWKSVKMQQLLSLKIGQFFTRALKNRRAQISLELPLDYLACTRARQKIKKLKESYYLKKKNCLDEILLTVKHWPKFWLSAKK